MPLLSLQREGKWLLENVRGETGEDYQLARNTSEPLKHCTGIISMPFPELNSQPALPTGILPIETGEQCAFN